jgi:hypothetical protein
MIRLIIITRINLVSAIDLMGRGYRKGIPVPKVVK